MYRIFVYGTLKEGEGNHLLLKGRSHKVGIGSVKGELFDLGPYPAMKEGDGVVHGEIYHVGEETLKDLDRLEGHPTFYTRKEVPALSGPFTSETFVQAYFYQPEFHHVVKKLPEGVWKRNISRR